MVVIAQRYKKLGIAALVLGVLCITLSSILFSTDFLSIAGLLLGTTLVISSLYVVLSPKEAIVRDGDKLIFCFLFGIKEYSISEFEYVSFHELGRWRDRDGCLVNFAILKNDVRRLTVTVRKNGKLEHFNLYSIEQATAVAATLSALKE